jgi:hypothetical protein
MKSVLKQVEDEKHELGLVSTRHLILMSLPPLIHSAGNTSAEPPARHLYMTAQPQLPQPPGVLVSET